MLSSIVVTKSCRCGTGVLASLDQGGGGDGSTSKPVGASSDTIPFKSSSLQSNLQRRKAMEGKRGLPTCLPTYLPTYH